MQATLEETVARSKVTAQQSTPVDTRTHPSRVAQIEEANRRPEAATRNTEVPQRTPSPTHEQWSAEDEAALKEIEDEETAIAERSKALANRKEKWRARHPAGPTTFTFHDNGVEYNRFARRPTGKGVLPSVSDDEDDVEIEKTLAPGVHSSPGSVADPNV
jgi:hypothetical protein